MTTARAELRGCAARDRGSVVVELVVLTPVLVLMAMFVAFVGRSVSASAHAQAAADAAARAAALATEAERAPRARAVVDALLAESSAGCASWRTELVVESQDADRFVTVTVSCALNMDALNALSPGVSATVATSTEVIDRHRAR